MSEKIISVLITGINGFIGKNLAQALIAEGMELIGISTEDTCMLPAVKHYEKADISDFDRMNAIFLKYRPDFVIHLAAIVHKKSLTADYDSFYKINFLSSERIFNLCKQYEVKKILFSSTVEVYDMKTGEVINETSRVKPSSDYGKTKLMAEESLISLSEASNLNYAIMRLAPAYGTDFSLNIDRRIYLIRKKLLYYFGNGSYFFNMCSINNIIDFIKAFIAGNHSSGIYNLSDSKNIQVKDLVAMEKRNAAAKGNSILPVSIRLPYYLTYFAIAIIEEILRIIRRKSVFSVYNFRKIFKCIIFDNTLASNMAGGLRWDVISTLYEGRWEHEKSI